MPTKIRPLPARHPEPAFLRRRLELATRLDAWVIGDDGDIHEWDGIEIVARLPGPWAPGRYFLTRGKTPGGFNWHAPILSDEWTALAAQPDFTMMTEIEATVPSGVRSIPCRRSRRGRATRPAARFRSSSTT